MAQPKIWFTGSDMSIRMGGLKTSTMGSTEYLNNSTGMTCDVWKAETTSSTSNLVISSQHLPYLTGSTGRYQIDVQSTAHGMARDTIGFVKYRLHHQTLNREWRVIFRVDDSYA